MPKSSSHSSEIFVENRLVMRCPCGYTFNQKSNNERLYRKIVKLHAKKCDQYGNRGVELTNHSVKGKDEYNDLNNMMGCFKIGDLKPEIFKNSQIFQ